MNDCQIDEFDTFYFSLCVYFSNERHIRPRLFTEYITTHKPHLTRVYTMFRTAYSRFLKVQASSQLSSSLYSSTIPKYSLNQRQFSTVPFINFQVNKRNYSVESKRDYRNESEFEEEVKKGIKTSFEQDFEIQERFLSRTKKEWRIPESEAKVPKVIGPIIFLVGIGAITFLGASWWTVKRTGDIVEKAEKSQNQLPIIHENFSMISKGCQDASWGKFAEQDLRVVSQANSFWQKMIRKTEEYCERNNKSDSFKKMIISFIRYPADISLSIREEQKATLPILAVSTAIFLTVNACRTGTLNSKTLNLLEVTLFISRLSTDYILSQLQHSHILEL